MGAADPKRSRPSPFLRSRLSLAACEENNERDEGAHTVLAHFPIAVPTTNHRLKESVHSCLLPLANVDTAVD
jgi:hypothetical protein